MFTASSRTSNLWSSNFIYLSLSNALLFAGFHLLLPTLPLFAANYGATSTQIGIIVGGFTFSAVLVRFFASAGIRRWGHKNFLRLGISICILSMAAYYFTANATTTIVVRLAHGFGFGIATTLYATLAADLVPSARRGEGMGYFTLGTIIMMAMAPWTGLWIFEDYQAEGLFIAGTALQVLSLLLLSGVAFAEHSARIASVQTRERFSFRVVLFPAFLSLLLGICMGGVMSFITLFAKEMNFTNPGLFFLTSTSCIFIIRTISGRIFDRLGPAWVIAPAALSLLSAMLILYNGSSFYDFISAAAFYGIGLGALFPALQTWMIQLTPIEKHTTANAAYFNSLDIGVGGGSILLGWFAAGRSFALVYLLTALISFLFFASYLIYLWRNRQSNEI